ncbi:acylneuraminate cytidylyltransferase [Microbacterium invictum]|uniref:N-acylneuraminate cytidylyltransferase n=1 Tax=Microbacterium invictum TaxID=515415 RepID=A0AA40SQM2_9MICO|nr:acylneuraminate cytidylyltransferase [Microbacterium invictum]MBB4140632.1 N-acylneuraminate cytidylyltransferase [Microbacterium invictum]
MTVRTGPQVVAVIPARGGSKGVPRKNLRPVAGVPLIVRAVRAARRAGSVDLVVVSTDDAEIAAVAAAAGARIVSRPEDLADDTAASETALIHALDVLAIDGIDPRIVVFVQATSPFIPRAGIDQAVAAVRDGYDSAFSAHETYGFLWRRADGAAAAVNHDAAHRPRRQDREPHYLETGAFYAFDAAGFRRSRHRFFGRTAIIEVPESTAIEIDDADQLARADALASLVEAPVADLIEVDAVVTDFDGVHTDDTAWTDADGRELVRVSRSDGMGVGLLRRAGIPVLILSTERNPVVRARADKLRVPVLQDVDDKAAALTAWAGDTGIPLARIAYLGNDVNDLPALALVGWPVATADAHPDVRAAARAVLTRRGGDGAVRELANLVLAGTRTPSPASADTRDRPA